MKKQMLYLKERILTIANKNVAIATIWTQAEVTQELKVPSLH